jgi:hypothetical protein
MLLWSHLLSFFEDIRIIFLCAFDLFKNNAHRTLKNHFQLRCQGQALMFTKKNSLSPLPKHLKIHFVPIDQIPIFLQMDAYTLLISCAYLHQNQLDWKIEITSRHMSCIFVPILKTFYLNMPSLPIRVPHWAHVIKGSCLHTNVL